MDRPATFLHRVRSILQAYTADLRPDRIAEFLVLNASFPHSIRFSADALETAMKQIGAEVSSRRSARVERIAGACRRLWPSDKSTKS